VAPTQDDVAAQVGDNGDDMAITTFLALAPRLRSVTYQVMVNFRLPKSTFYTLVSIMICN
jgi:S-adenosylmethionine:tRNA-ribosyltransferase-isomerase (queuine synthetase)